jgi:NADH-quinone oxidoreductase subunit A
MRLPNKVSLPKLQRVDSQLTQYLPVLILALAAMAFAGATLVMSVVVGKWANKNRLNRQVSRTKNIPYECGMLPVGEGNTRMSVKFYLVAMLFILFDIEVVFLYPWAVVYREMLKDNANLIFGAMVSFLGILFVGYLYALKKGALDWKS